MMIMLKIYGHYSAGFIITKVTSIIGIKLVSFLVSKQEHVFLSPLTTLELHPWQAGSNQLHSLFIMSFQSKYLQLALTSLLTVSGLDDKFSIGFFYSSPNLTQAVQPVKLNF